MSKGGSFDDIMGALHKQYGTSIGGKNAPLPDVERIPFQPFHVTLESGGGIPKGRITEIYGAEGSCKTNLALGLIANHQRLWPDQMCAWFDVEGTYDKAWAKRYGVDNEKLYIIRPQYAEQLVDMCEALLHADNCGLVVIDSLAAMVTIRESEQSAEKQDVGGEAQAIKKLVKKATLAMNDAVKIGRSPTLLMINQTRMKIGVMFGSPETTPGGMAKNFFCSMRIRAYGADEMDSTISKTMPVNKKMIVTMIKWKCPIVAKSAEFKMTMIPHKGKKTGDCADWSLIQKYLEDYGWLKKADKSGYLMFDKPYKTLIECRAHVEQDVEFGDTVRAAIIEQARTEALALEFNESKADGQSVPEEE